MQAADLAIIKEIPGYQIIMKAVLKNQIQQLVEQLLETTGEESILLTASVSDGTLSHLGSESGKSFLDGHEDIKSQFLGYVLKRHHTRKTEKQFASAPGRKSTTQQSLPLMNESGATLTEASFHTEPQQDVMLQLSMVPTPTWSVGKRKGRVKKPAVAQCPVKSRPKRSVAAMKSPFKSDIYEENEEEIELSESELEQKNDTATSVTDSRLQDTTGKYTSVKSVVPVSGPIPVVPELETENLFATQEHNNSSADISEAMGKTLEFDSIVVKQEVVSDIEAENDGNEDPDWEPGTKKRRKNSGFGSSSVTSPVNVSGFQSVNSAMNVTGDQAQLNVKKTRLSSAEKQRRYRNRRDSDPVKRQLYLQKQKAIYLKKGQTGETKLVKNMTAAEHSMMKEKWRFFKQKERKKRKEVKEKMLEHRTQQIGSQMRKEVKQKMFGHRSQKLDSQMGLQYETSLENDEEIKSELEIKE